MHGIQKYVKLKFMYKVISHLTTLYCRHKLRNNLQSFREEYLIRNKIVLLDNNLQVSVNITL